VPVTVLWAVNARTPVGLIESMCPQISNALEVLLAEDELLDLA